MKTKKEWVMPEIYDLDIDKTKTGDWATNEDSTTSGPTS